MLVLSRYLDQEIIIGDNEVIIKVLSINENQVKLGFQAKKDLSIHRKELYNKITSTISNDLPPEVRKSKLKRLPQHKGFNIS